MVKMRVLASAALGLSLLGLLGAAVGSYTSDGPSPARPPEAKLAPNGPLRVAANLAGRPVELPGRASAQRQEGVGQGPGEAAAAPGLQQRQQAASSVERKGGPARVLATNPAGKVMTLPATSDIVCNPAKHRNWQVSANAPCGKPGGLGQMQGQLRGQRGEPSVAAGQHKVAFIGPPVRVSPPGHRRDGAGSHPGARGHP